MDLNKVLTAFDEISKDSSRLKKEEIFTKLLKKEEHLTKEILQFTFDPFSNYYVRLKEKDYPKVNAEYKDSSADQWWSKLQKLLVRASKGSLRGGALKESLQTIVKVRPQYAYWFMRIVNRDLKMGLSDRTIEKVLPGLIPNAKRQLCSTLDINDPDLAQLEGWYLEPKYDGLRATAIVENYKITILSRKGKPVWNCEHIIEEIEKLGVNNVALDGEFYAGSWNDSISIAHSQATHEQKAKLKFFIFDYIPLKEWKECKGEMRLKQRKEKLKLHFGGNKFKHIVQGPYQKIGFLKSKGEKETVQEWLDEAIKDGFEGIVLKNPKGKYRFKRSKDWLKLKPYFEGDFKITGWKEGTGKHRGKVGALFVKGTTEFRGKKYKIKCRVGSGILDKDRERLMHLAKTGKLEGNIVQMEYIEVSMKKGKDGYHALKNPVYTRLRTDK